MQMFKTWSYRRTLIHRCYLNALGFKSNGYRARHVVFQKILCCFATISEVWSILEVEEEALRARLLLSLLLWTDVDSRRGGGGESASARRKPCEVESELRQQQCIKNARVFAPSAKAPAGAAAVVPPPRRAAPAAAAVCALVLWHSPELQSQTKQRPLLPGWLRPFLTLRKTERFLRSCPPYVSVPSPLVSELYLPSVRWAPIRAAGTYGYRRTKFCQSFPSSSLILNWPHLTPKISLDFVILRLWSEFSRFFFSLALVLCLSSCQMTTVFVQNHEVFSNMTSFEQKSGPLSPLNL